MKLLEKTQKWIFYLLIVLLPAQLGLHFWPDWAFVNGVRVDYFSPTLFLTDVFVFGILILEMPQLRSFGSLRSLGMTILPLLIVSALMIGNIVTSLSPAVSVYKWLKVLEFSFLGIWIYQRFKAQGLRLKTILSLLLVPVIFESALGIWQFWAQSSIGGIWYFLGERTFNSSTPGIANTFFNGQLILRPYGTFPHPNVLGGFLAVVLPLVLVQFLRNSRKNNARGTKLTKLICASRRNFAFREIWELIKWSTLALGYVALFLSMSRVAILVGVTASVIVLVPYLKIIRWIGPIGLISLIGLSVFILPRFNALRVEREAIEVREQLNDLALKQFARSPIWGTGLGTAPMYGLQTTVYRLQQKNYALRYQPTHNGYLLVLAEIGVMGLGMLGLLGIWGVRKLLLEKNYEVLTPLFSILVLGLFDHYFLTLQQGQLLLILILGWVWAKKA